jgi:hypothetical protein
VSPVPAKPGRRNDVTREDMKVLALAVIAIAIVLIFLFGVNITES